MAKKKTTEVFVEEAQSIHGDKYDYSKTIYTTKRNKVIIICPIHGEFFQAAGNHLRNGGCKLCGMEASAEAQLGDITFFNKAKDIHGDLSILLRYS